MKNIIHRKEYTVHVYETGVDEKLNPVALFNYLQDIAAEHAVNLGFGRDELMRMNRFWILSRMAVEIIKWPSWNEKTVVTTWPRGTDKMFAVRDFSVEYPDGKMIAAATSSWLIVDLATKRIQRPGENLGEFVTDPGINAALGRYAVKIEPLSELTSVSESFRVKMSDLDVNRHTNNANYIRWMLDSYSADFLHNHRPVSFEVNYLSESRLGDEVTIRTGRMDNSRFFHSAVRTTDNTELCRIIAGWENCML